MNGVQGLITGVTQFILGAFGISLIVLAVASFFITAMLKWTPVKWAFEALAFGGLAFTAAWAASFIHA